MTTDIERSYTGTNFVVITLLVLVSLALIYAFVAHIDDVADNDALQAQQSSIY